jgi:hypothetical protein
MSSSRILNADTAETIYNDVSTTFAPKANASMLKETKIRKGPKRGEVE